MSIASDRLWVILALPIRSSENWPLILRHMVNILHISDLHRDSGSKLTTASLVESLRLDRARYLGAGLGSPDVAIVSGDIVYGVTSNDATSDAALRSQYEEANDFLVRLADLLFGTTFRGCLFEALR